MRTCPDLNSNSGSVSGMARVPLWTGANELHTRPCSSHYGHGRFPSAFPPERGDENREPTEHMVAHSGISNAQKMRF